MGKSIHLILVNFSELSRKLGAKSADIECEGCEIVMKKLIGLIGDNKTEVHTIVILICTCLYFELCHKKNCIWGFRLGQSHTICTAT